MSDDSSKTANIKGYRPVDRLALKGMIPGERAPAMSLRSNESLTPIQTWPWRGRGCKKSDDLTGKTKGLLTVVGYAAEESRFQGLGMQPRGARARGSKWVVRCVCGVYATRMGKRFRKPGWDACSQCIRKGLRP
jgi:hypothetical protein